MADVVSIRKLKDHVGAEVCLQGWLYNKRGSKKLRFLEVRDGSGVVQCVVSADDVSEDIFAEVDKVNQESSLRVTGKVMEDERSKLGVELHVTDFNIVQLANDYPITKLKKGEHHGPDFLLSNRHLWIRHSKPHAILTVRARLVKATRDFFDDNGFLLVDTPIFTPNACEGTSTLFEVQYTEEEKAYLTQSGQLYNEANAMAFGKVYSFGPTFRAEKSKTRKHLREFWMVEPEMAWCGLEENMQVAEQFVSYLAEQVLAHCQTELDLLERDQEPLKKITGPFPRLHYDDAVKLLKEGGIDFEWGGDFGAPDENLIASSFDKPVFVTHFPAAIKAFYMAPDPDSPKHSLSVDLLAPEGYGEIIGGGERATDYDYLLGKVKEHELSEEDFGWYLDLRRYGSCPHAGFGLGLERTVSWFCGIEHVREAVPYPRTLYRIYP